MPTYTIRDPKSGKTIKLTGDSPPTAGELEQIFATASPQKGIGAHVLDAAKGFGGTVYGAVDAMGRALIPEVVGESIGLGKTGPVNAVNSLFSASGEELQKAKASFQGGDMATAARHVMGSAPGIGPMLSQASDEMVAGNYGKGLGQTLGAATVAVGPKPIARAATSAVTAVMPKAAASAATALETGAAGRYADVMAPKVGPNKMRFGNAAERVAPKLAADPAMRTWTREGLHDAVATKLTEAEAALDAASQARNARQVYPTAPILADLQGKLSALTSQTVKGPAAPTGQNVIPAPLAARAAQIRQAMTEVQQLGPQASYDALRNIRQAYDGPAKAVYNQSMTADFLAKQGEKMGAADVTGVLREKLAGYDPTTAAANAQYSLYRAANDVLEATREVERTRPRVGRQIVTRLMTTTVGAGTGGLGGAAAGFVLSPVLDAALASGVTTKLQTAQAMSRLAQAIRSGNVASVHSLTEALTRGQVAGRAATIGVRATGATPAPSLADESERTETGR